MSKVFIKRTRGLQKISQVKAHAKYVGFRSKEAEEKGFFSRDEDRADYKKFIDRIEKNPALKHPQSIKAQKLIFSLRQVDYDAYKRSGKDYKQLVRKTLAEYERKHGVKLDYIANIHEKEGHPHCHVIIKGVSDSKDEKGRFKRVKFTKEDFKEMKEDFDKEFEKDVQYKLSEKYDIPKVMSDISKGFEQVLKAMARDAEKDKQLAEAERAMEAKRQAEKESRRNDRDR